METIFSKIIQGDIPCFKVYEDTEHLAFLDIQPVQMGHVLVIPKKEVDYYFDMNPEDFAKLNAVAQRIAVALKKAVPCVKVGMSVVGLEVPHAHIHLIPINTINDMNFNGTRLSLSHQQGTELASLIQSYV